LAVEVLVEAAQRLLRPLDDLLDRELGRALLVDQLEGRVEKALDALFGPRPRRVEAAGDRPLAPLWFVSDGVSVSHGNGTLTLEGSLPREPFSNSVIRMTTLETPRLYIDASWVEATGADEIEVINPATEEVIARVPQASTADVDRAVDSARRAFDAGPWP